MGNPKSGNFYMGIILAFQFLSVFVLALAMVLLGDVFDIGMQLTLNQTVSFLIPLFCCFVYVRYTGRKITDILKIKKISIKNIFLIVAMGIFVQPAMMIVSSISAIFFENQVADVLMDLSGYSVVYFIFVMAVVPAVCEELTFRGIIYSCYEKTNVKAALIINGLFFGLMHTNFQQFFYAFILGILLAVLVYYTGSIFASITMHFTINASQVLLLKLSMYLEESGFYLESTETVVYTFADYLPTILLIIAFTIVFIKLFSVFIRDNIPAKDKARYTNEFSVNRPSFYVVCLLYVAVTFLLN